MRVRSVAACIAMKCFQKTHKKPSCRYDSRPYFHTADFSN